MFSISAGNPMKTGGSGYFMPEPENLILPGRRQPGGFRYRAVLSHPGRKGKPGSAGYLKPRAFLFTILKAGPETGGLPVPGCRVSGIRKLLEVFLFLSLVDPPVSRPYSNPQNPDG
jgi:hypothetical protein